MNQNCIEAKTIGELFGTLQESVIVVWRQHLNTNKHSVHVIIDEYYKGAPEYIDNIIEHYMGIFGKNGISYINVLCDEYSCPIEYLQILREFVKSGRFLLKGETELESDLDDILGFIDSILYKLKELTNSEEHYSLSNFVKDKISYSNPDGYTDTASYPTSEY